MGIRGEESREREAGGSASGGPVSVPIRRLPPVEGDEGEQGLYIISVAARLLRMHPQTLRKYERLGLVSPARTGGMLRLYSERDIARLRLIKYLVEEVGMNLAGVEMLLRVFNHLEAARRRLRAMAQEWVDPQRLLEQVEAELDRLLAIIHGEA